MKAITLCQPWAHLVIHGPKRWENRSWRTSHRGLIAIHAGSSRCRMPELYQLPRKVRKLVPPQDELVFGAIIGVVEIVDVQPIDEVRSQPFAIGPWCWRLEKPRALREPIPIPGQRRIWTLPPHVARAIMRQLKPGA